MAKKSPEDIEFEKIDNLRIMKLFRGRCIVCFRPASHVHELITRGRSKQALTLPQNRVPLCEFDHNMQHQAGYTQPKEDFLRNRAIELLVRYGESLESW